MRSSRCPARLVPMTAPAVTAKMMARLKRHWILMVVAVVLTSCGTAKPAATGPSGAPKSASTSAPDPATPAPATVPRPSPVVAPLPTPAPLPATVPGGGSAQGVWTASGRTVDGVPAVYETSLVPPGGTQAAGIAWMDTRLLSAMLYSGSISPGGGPYTYTAPVEPAQAASLVAAFNGGFVMNVAGGGYYTEGRLIDPLVPGAASLVISANGSVDVGPWGGSLTMTPAVVSVRQNLVPLVAAEQPTPAAASPDWQAWGATCGATSCASSVPGIEYQWRSGVGVTADGALVYASGPALDPMQLAQLLVAAGVVSGMQLDINPNWPILATYDPPTPGGLAAPSNGTKLVASSVQGPGTFFEPTWARDFVTMSVKAPTSSS